MHSPNKLVERETEISLHKPAPNLPIKSYIQR
jgi:hypothetical protein